MDVELETEISSSLAEGRARERPRARDIHIELGCPETKTDSQFSTHTERLTNTCGRLFRLVVDIVMPSCSLEESDPLKFISTESLPDFNGSNLHSYIWTFPNKTLRS